MDDKTKMMLATSIERDRQRKIKEIQKSENIDLKCYFNDKSYNECKDSINNLNNSIFNKKYFTRGDIEFLKEYREYLTFINRNIKEGTTQFLNDAKNDFGHDVEFIVSDLNSDCSYIDINVKDIDESFSFWKYHKNKELTIFENIYDEEFHQKKLEIIYNELKTMDKYYKKDANYSLNEIDTIFSRFLRVKDDVMYDPEFCRLISVTSVLNSSVLLKRDLYKKAINTEITDNKKIITEVNRYYLKKLLEYYELEELNIQYSDIKNLKTFSNCGETLLRQNNTEMYIGQKLYEYNEDYEPLNETVVKLHPLVPIKRKVRVH